MAGATLEALVDEGFIKTFADIYHLDRYKDQIIALDGFGKRSYEKIQEGVEVSRDAAFSSFLAAFGAPLIGRHIGKLLEKQFGTLDALLQAVDNGFDFASLEGMGPKKAANLVAWLKDPESRQEVLDVAKEVRFKQPPKRLPRTTPSMARRWWLPALCSTSPAMASTRSWRSWVPRLVLRCPRRPIMSLPGLAPAANWRRPSLWECRC